jgi:hypothetical protein
MSSLEICEARGDPSLSQPRIPRAASLGGPPPSVRRQPRVDLLGVPTVLIHRNPLGFRRARGAAAPTRRACNSESVPRSRRQVAFVSSGLRSRRPARTGSVREPTRSWNRHAGCDAVRGLSRAVVHHGPVPGAPSASADSDAMEEDLSKRRYTTFVRRCDIPTQCTTMRCS